MKKQFISKTKETFLTKILRGYNRFPESMFSYYNFINKTKHIYTALPHLEAHRHTGKGQEGSTLSHKAIWVPSFPLFFSFPAMIWVPLLAGSRRKPVISEKHWTPRKLCVNLAQGAMLIFSISLEIGHL